MRPRSSRRCAFRTDGTLRAIPLPKGYECAKLEESHAGAGMNPVKHVHNYRGFVFARLNDVGPGFEEFFGEEFRVAAGEEDGVGLAVGRLVGEGREEADCGAGPPPALKHVGIGEPEGHIAGDRDGLAEGRERRRRPGTGGEC